MTLLVIIRQYLRLNILRQCRQRTYLEVDLILLSILALVEEGVDDAVPERVDGQLGYAEEVLAGEVALPCLVQA
jgi:hypothetical protein